MSPSIPPRRRAVAATLAVLLALPVGGVRADPTGGAFSGAADYSELRGLPPRPSVMDLRVDQLRALFDGAFPELFGSYTVRDDQGAERTVAGALERYAPETRVRVVEAWSRRYPVQLAGSTVMVPNADGVIAEAKVKPPAVSGIDAACDPVTGTYTCQPIYRAGVAQRDQEVIIVVGWDVELLADVTTDARSLIVVAERFSARAHTIATGPRKLDDPAPEPNLPGDTAAAGRSARPGGQFALFANVVDGVRADATSLAGERGLAGRRATGTVTKNLIADNRTPSPSLICEGQVTEKAQNGGAGGGGGAGGDLIVRYVSWAGKRPARGRPETAATDERRCAGRCDAPECKLNPSIAVCDVLREADDVRCSDGKDNDADGLTDCKDPSCLDNAFVTVCPARRVVMEASVEACTDGADNDGDGRIDCADPDCRRRQVCGAAPGQPFYPTTGLEEATDAACGNGLDDDLDNVTDCDDPECRRNPLVVKACGAERTPEACTDGVDNDGDGLADCKDDGCANNPYVLLCERTKYPFLAEASAATCSDGKDNDGNHFTDCRDFQCTANPLAAPACGVHENRLDDCRNGKDDDGDGRADCSDPDCQMNPFFGAMLCGGKPKSGHKQRNDGTSSFNGATLEADVSLVSKGSAAGAGGPGGAPLAVARVVRVSHAPCEGDEPACEYNERRECVIGGGASDGKNGQAGAGGAISVRPIDRRAVDRLRSLLSPRQWTVGTAQANALFKRATADSVREAGFLYLHDQMRIRGVLAAEGVDCPSGAKPFAGLSPRAAFLVAALCPSLARDALRLTYLTSGRNFFGAAPRVPINPRERYADQHAAFVSRFDALENNVQKWIDLANGLDTSAQLAATEQGFNDTAAALTAEIALGRARESAALASLRAIQEKKNNRTQALATIKSAIETNNATIKSKYDNGGLGQLILDLAGAYLKAYGGDLLLKGGEAMATTIGADLKRMFAAEKGPSVPSTPAPKPGEAESMLGQIWEQVKSAAGAAVKSEPVKKAASSVGAEIGAILSGGPATPVRSVMVDEVANEILKASQVQITLDYLDLVIDERKAQADYEIARMEREVSELRQSLALAGADRVAHYRASSELRAYDKVLLGQQFYASALLLVEDLTQRYWRLLRQAEYEFLPYGPTGQSELYAQVTGKSDFNLLNYQDLDAAVLAVHQDMSTRLRGNRATFYRRVPAAALARADESDAARLAAIGLAPGGTAPPMVAHVRVGYDDIDADALLQNRRNVRVDDVRVNVIGAAAGAARPVVYLVRDGLDGFRVRRTGGKDYFTDFDISAVDLSANGAARGPLQYQSFRACTSGPPPCDPLSPACATPFAAAPLDDWSCGLYGTAPGPTPWLQNTFYDRSLRGDWLLVMTDATYRALGEARALELQFVVSSVDL